MSEPVEGSVFRTAMRRVPSPVVVVTATGQREGVTEARGITIGSFTSVALDPPLVSFNVARDSQMYPLMETCSRFAVNVLGEGQAHLAERFAEPDLSGAEQFEGLPYTRDAHGIPMLDGVSVRFHCVPHDAVPAGDKTLYVGLVVQVDEQPDDGAVLYYRSSYRGVGSELPSTELSPVKRVSSESS